MRTHIEYDPREGVYRVWAWQRQGHEVFPMEYRPIPGPAGFGLAYDAEAGQPVETSLRDTPPTLVLDYEIVEALIENHEPGLSPRNALGEHLKDARAVRDRLLALVERQTA